jgi:hypothetical protein
VGLDRSAIYIKSREIEELSVFASTDFQSVEALPGRTSMSGTDR